MPNRRTRGRTLTRFNKWSMGRGALLTSKGASRVEISHYFFQRYGKEWRIPTEKDMERYLFGRGYRSVNFGRMFGEKSLGEIREKYLEWLQGRQKQREAATKMAIKRNQNPAFRDANQRRMIERMKIREFRELSGKTSRDPEQIENSKKKLAEYYAAHPEAIERNRKLMQKINAEKKRKKRTKKTRNPVPTTFFADFGSDGVVYSNESIHQPAKQKAVIADHRSPVQVLISRGTEKIVRTAVNSLPRRERRVITGLFFEHQDKADLANQMKTDLKTIDAILNRATRKLAQKLNKVA